MPRKLFSPPDATSLNLIQNNFTHSLRNGKKPRQKDYQSKKFSERFSVYKELFVNDILLILEEGFPQLFNILSYDYVFNLAADFIKNHPCDTPFFYEIPGEFIDYLVHERAKNIYDPKFLLELAHYQWVGLTLDIAEEELNHIGINRKIDLGNNCPVLSPLVCLLQYKFPVHKINFDYIPITPQKSYTYLVGWRDSKYNVNFMEINYFTARLIEVINNAQNSTGYDCLSQVAAEINHPNPDSVVGGGINMLKNLMRHEIIIGAFPITKEL